MTITHLLTVYNKGKLVIRYVAQVHQGLGTFVHNKYAIGVIEPASYRSAISFSGQVNFRQHASHAASGMLLNVIDRHAHYFSVCQ